MAVTSLVIPVKVPSVFATGVGVAGELLWLACAYEHAQVVSPGQTFR